MSVSGRSAMTTPAAWIESWRTRPSSGFARSTISRTSGSASYAAAQLLPRLHRLLEVHLRPFGNELRDPVDGAVRDLEHAAGVANGRARHHRPEGDDLRDAVAPVLLGGVVDHAVAPGYGEVDVDVGHGLPPRVQHALEQQVVLHRVDLGDAQAVGDERPGGRSSSRADADAVPAGERDEVPDDQEVVGEAHLADRLQLECEPLVELRRPLRVAAGEPLLGELHEVLERVAALGRRVRRQQDLSQLERHRAALGDLERARERILVAGEVEQHLGLGLEEELVGVELPVVGVLQRVPRLDAEQRLVRRARPRGGGSGRRRWPRAAGRPSRRASTSSG